MYSSSPLWASLPRVIPVPKTQQRGEEELVCFILEGAVQGPFKNGKRTRGERFCSPRAPEGVAWGRSPSRNPRSSVCSREFRNTFSRCCPGQPRRNRTLPPRFSSLLLFVEEWADLQIAGKFFFPAFSAALEPFWPKIVCPGFVLSLSPADCCLWKFWNCGGCYLLFDIFSHVLSHFVSLLVKGDWLKRKGR